MTENRIRRRCLDLAIGFRLAVSGGPSGVLRTALSAIGIGLAVALLLVAASLPTILDGRNARGAAADISWTGGDATDRTMLIRPAGTRYRGMDIDGYLLQPEGVDPPIPPGVTRLPGPGELVVSPALARLLASPEGEELLRPRLDGRIIGVIAEDAVIGPQSHYYYAGTTTLSPDTDSRIDGFGVPDQSVGLPPVLVLLSLVAVTVLLLPVVFFAAIAARFGGEQRDRRLAALRLIGADRAMSRRIASGEALLAGLAGLACGVVMFLVGRQFVEYVEIAGLSVFASDVTPNPILAALVVLLVPVVTVGIGVLAMRRVAVEPLGVFRRSTPARRRLWWRLLLPVVGAALLYGASGEEVTDSIMFNASISVGLILVLGGAVALMPWGVDAAVRRLRGGPVSWQLATRRLQLGGDMMGRAVSGVAVAAAGAVALQMMFFGVEQQFTWDTGIDDDQRSRLVTSSFNGDVPVEAMTARLDRVDGVETDLSYRTFYGTESTEGTGDSASPSTHVILVADCPVLSQLLAIDDCRDGDAFVSASDPHMSSMLAGQALTLEDGTEWAAPSHLSEADLRNPKEFGIHGRIMITPSLVDGAILSQASVTLWLWLDVTRPDAEEHARNIIEPTGEWRVLRSFADRGVDDQFDGIRRGILVGVVAVMALVAVSLLVGMFEQLQDRRRLLSVMAAFGAKRSAMGWSVLWQVTIPVILGLVFALVFGTITGGLLQTLSGLGRVFIDWAHLGVVSIVSFGVITVVTAVSLPMLWRLMRSDGLRTE